MEQATETNIRENYHARVRTEVLELVPEGDFKVLDVGGGIGSSLAYLKSVGKCAHAVVVDLVADECLPEVDAAYGGNLEDGSLLQQIAQEQGQMDVILCLDVLEHLTNPWSVIESCRKILKPGGIIVASIPNVRYFSLVVPLVFQGKFELKDSGIMDRTHLRWFVRNTAIELMTPDGLTLEYVKGQIYGKRKNLLNTITFGLFQNFLQLQYFIRVRRSD